MERYDYLEAVKEDIRCYIGEQYTEDEQIEQIENRDEWEQQLYDDLFISDSVTGNASGSYFCNSWKAEECLCHNFDLLAEALNEFGSDIRYLENGAEACDVTIRCYLLGQAINEALDELEETIADMTVYHL